MSPNDGTTSETSEVGDALVAALGFEPTTRVVESDGRDKVDESRSTEADRSAVSVDDHKVPGDHGDRGGRTLSADDWVEAVQPDARTSVSPDAADAGPQVDTESSEAKPLPLLPDFLQPPGSDEGELPPGAVSPPDEGPISGRLGGETVRAEAPDLAPPSGYPDGYALAPRADVGRPDRRPPSSPMPAAAPPPPYIGDPGAVPTPGATTAEVAAVRPGLSRNGAAQRAGEIAARVPELFERGLKQRAHRVRARKVRRVVRHIDPWSVLTFSVLFHLCVFAALLLASVLVWNAAVAAGTIENIENFIRELGDYQTYEIQSDVVFRAAMVIAGILTLASSVLMVLLTVVFNLISDLVGGIRMTVVEEETVRVRRQRNQ